MFNFLRKPNKSKHLTRTCWLRLSLALTLLATWFYGNTPATAQAAATIIDILPPPGSGAFGLVALLPNGNWVVADALYDTATATDVGAVYLYDGDTLALISQITGSTTKDEVGKYGVFVLPSGDYVFHSPFWNNGAIADAGAVTWCSGVTGCVGTVSAANSLVGSSPSDQVGGEIVLLNNGSYLVSSLRWDRGSVTDVGAVTWCPGTQACAGAVSVTNSLVGKSAGDQVGRGTLRLLANGNYVVGTSTWDNGPALNAGAVTWCSGTGGCVGEVSPANSLVGSVTNDWIGAVYALANGHYVAGSSMWDNGNIVDAGAVTWCDGTLGCTGVVSVTNSLVGSSPEDWVGYGGFILNNVLPLDNGNYVVYSPGWNSPTAQDAGAITWCSGEHGCVGTITTTNSLVGSNTNDVVGVGGIMTLTNNSYVVSSPYWDNETVTDAGAVTWCSSQGGCVGPVGINNSLVGSSVEDMVGMHTAQALANDNYIVRSPEWNNGDIPNAGAVTWCSGAVGCVGAVTTANSLVGQAPYDQVGAYYGAMLTDGDYVVASPDWDNGPVVDVGAVTWCNGQSGCVGAVQAANSLMGSTAGDKVGGYIAALPNGSYIIESIYWNNGAIQDAGAVTWCSGVQGCLGVVSAANSLVGSTAGDQVGRQGSVVLTNGHYVVPAPYWDNGPAVDAGAVTWCNGSGGCVGAVSASNSLVGTTTGDQVGVAQTVALPDGHYVVRSPRWDNGSISNAGAMTYANGDGSTVGLVSGQNSLVGVGTEGGSNMHLNYAYDATRACLAVGRTLANNNGVSLWCQAPQAQLSAATYTAQESEGSVTLTATLSSPLPITITLTALTADGTALSGGDYIPLSQTLTFAPGVTTVTFTVALVEDAQIEEQEAFSVTLTAPTHTTLGSPATATIFIMDSSPQHKLYLSLVGK